MIDHPYRFPQLLLLILLLLSTAVDDASAQKRVRSLNRDGNRHYAKERYQEAEQDYRRAIELNAQAPVSIYNLGSTLYRTNRAPEASKLYQQLLQSQSEMSQERRADLAHNAGNALMREKNYADAIEMYKESLRHRPTDEETRYNLALAQKLLQKQNQEQDQDKDQQSQDDKQDQNQEQPQPDQSQPEQQPAQPQPQNGMSRETAEQILKAYLRDEKATHEKIEQQQAQPISSRKKKNW